MKRRKYSVRKYSIAWFLQRILPAAFMITLLAITSTKVNQHFEKADAEVIERAQIVTEQLEAEGERSVNEMEAYYPITEEEGELIKAIIRGEVRGCSCEHYECYQAVAECIRNRSVLWGKSIEDVCLAPNQFCTPYYDKLDDEREMWLNEAMSSVFFWGDQMFDEPILHFHASYCNPYWSDDFTKLAEMDGTVYYN